MKYHLQFQDHGLLVACFLIPNQWVESHLVASQKMFVQYKKTRYSTVRFIGITMQWEKAQYNRMLIGLQPINHIKEQTVRKENICKCFCIVSESQYTYYTRKSFFLAEACNRPLLNTFLWRRTAHLNKYLIQQMSSHRNDSYLLLSYKSCM